MKYYAIKTQTIKGDIDFTPQQRVDMIHTEIKIAKKMGKLGVGPIIYDYYICKESKKKGYVIFIIMQYMYGGRLEQWGKIPTQAQKKELQ